MEEQTIIIADRDVAYRSRMASFFRKAGYRVEATGSTDQVLNRILANEAPVLLLGSDFGSQVASAELVHLLKKCNRQLQIIMVADELALVQARELRQEGIFFHALKPASAGEAAELGQVVACAFEKTHANARLHPASAALAQSADPAELTRSPLMNAMPWIAGMAALILGTNYVSIPSAHGAQNGGSFSVWLFLGFCAMIVAGQLLPIFRIKLEGRAHNRQLARENSQLGGK
jgi:DNA-binding NtrC family response regulator